MTAHTPALWLDGARKHRGDHLEEMRADPESAQHDHQFGENRPHLAGRCRGIDLVAEGFEALDEPFGIVENDAIPMPGAAAAGDIRDLRDLGGAQDALAALQVADD